MRREGVCGESFVPHVRRARVCGESFVPHVRRARVCWESFVPKRQGVVVVGRIMSCSGVVLVPVGGLWRRPGAAHGHCGRALRAPGVLHAGGGGGCAPCEALRGRVVGVSQPWMAQFPPIGGGEIPFSVGVAPKVQTISVKRTQIRQFWLNGSALWRNWCVQVWWLSDSALYSHVLAAARAAGPHCWQC